MHYTKIHLLFNFICDDEKSIYSHIFHFLRTEVHLYSTLLLPHNAVIFLAGACSFSRMHGR